MRPRNNATGQEMGVSAADLVYTEGVDTYANPGKVTRTLAVSKQARKAYFEKHEHIARLLLREETNPLLEEGGFSGGSREREGELYLTYEALTLLVESTLKKYENRMNADTQAIYVLRNDQDRLIEILRAIDFNLARHAKIIYVDGIHSVPFILGCYMGRIHCFIVDSEAGEGDDPDDIINAVRMVFPSAVIALSDVLLQKDFYSCTTFAFKTLLYFIKHGHEVFPFLYRNRALVDSAQTYDFRVPAAKMMPELLKMAQDKIVFSQKLLDTVVSHASGLTLGLYLKKYAISTIKGPKNSAALLKKYLYMARIDACLSTSLADNSDQPAQTQRLSC